MLSDFLYYHPNSDAEPWLIYYISKPLLGSYDPGTIPQAVVPGYSEKVVEPAARNPRRDDRNSGSSTEIRSFEDLLSRFPMIARQMQVGLERVFREFGKEFGKPLPPPPSPSPSASEFAENEHIDEAYRTSGPFSIHEDGYFTRLPFGSSYMEADEDIMRRALETAVTAAIDLFRQVDKQQLMLLGATTDLTGPLVERLIERYVAEQAHDPLLFPRLCAYHEVEDAELEIRIRRMESIDVSQVGIAIEGGRKGKEELIIRLAKGVVEFRRIIDAKSPHAMLDVLLSTVKTITVPPELLSNGECAEEKEESPMPAINADILVSLLLVVVIRSQVRHLRARLLYMQQFIFIDDVESGEAGYALSTLEAVLTYLREDSAGLRRASARNKRLWTATKAGKISDMKAILEPGENSLSEDSTAQDGTELSALEQESNGESASGTQMNGRAIVPDGSSFDESPERPQTPRLTHVFPFHNWANDRPDSSPELPAPRKKVSMDVRSLSELSSMSYLSHSTTGASIASGIEGDISIESLTKTQDPAGDSVPMMAIEAHRADALEYLLSLQEYYPIQSILEDTNSNGTTLLSAAVQLGDAKIVDILLRFIFDHAPNPQDVLHYFSKADSRGRTVAHYVFSVPSLITQLGSSLPWTQKDKLGQTPLFALCRSYDHPEYNRMVNQALSAAQEAQRDGQPLRVDDHVDARGNTLLHIVSDPQILYRILKDCDCDPNATNDKRFTPLMTASKYGRVDLVRLFFHDPRVDVHLREARGFTAVELAKDEEVRNRIDDFVLFSNPAISSPNEPSNRVTTVVRSLCIDENTVRFIIKSGAPNPPDPSEPEGNKYATTYMVTTCRRSMEDFENLVKCLKLEHPASYLPKIPFFRSPYQMFSRPSRAVVHAVQDRLDKLLKTLLAHPTFATHELLWEFFLVPEMQPAMIEERSNRKAAVLKEYISDDYEPVNNDDMRDIEQLMAHALDAVRAMGHATSKVIRRGYTYHHATTDFAEAISICAGGASSLATPTNALPQAYIDAFNRYAASYAATSPDSSPLIQFLSAITSTHATTTAMETALVRPRHRISDLQRESRQLSRLHSTVASSSLPRKFAFPGMEESRLRHVREQEEKIGELTKEINWLGKEIRWNKDVVLGELAGWTAWREKMGRDAIRIFARTSLVRERERGKRLERCLRSVREMKDAPHGF